MRVAHANSSEQSMHPDTAQERVRRRVCAELVPQIAELILRADKGSKHMKLEDLRSESSQYLYLDIARRLVEPLRRLARVALVHQSDAHQFASADAEQQDVMRQARQDIERFGGVLPGVTSHFGSVRPGHCWVCTERITPADSYVLELSATLKADVHGRCCQNDSKFELMSAFSFRLIDGARR